MNFQLSRKICLTALVVFGLLANEFNAAGQTGSANTNARSVCALSGPVGSVLLQPDGKIILAGGGAQDASAELTRLVDRIQAPVIAYRTGQGVIDARNPFSHRFPAGHALWKDVDVVIGIGTRLQHVLDWGRDDAMKIIHIDIDPSRIGRTCTPDVAIVADAAEALAALLGELERTGGKAASRKDEIINVFAQDTISLIPDRLNLVAGLKYESTDYASSAWLPSLRLAFMPSARQTWWTAASDATRVPSRLESDLTFFSTIRPGDGFGAEKVRAYELGQSFLDREDQRIRNVITAMTR